MVQKRERVERLQIMLSEQDLASVDDFRFGNRMPGGDSRSGGFQARAPSERRQFCDYRLEVDRLWRPSDKAE
jgi:hypothetical protein